VRTRIKFCGMTSPDDVALAVAAGADAVGIIVARSERSVTLERAAAIAKAIPPYVTGIGVVAEDTSLAPDLRDLGLTLQFSGPTPPDECERFAAGRPYIKAFGVGPGGDIQTGRPEFGVGAYEHALWMFDSSAPGRYGGTGIVFRWEVLAELAHQRPLVVSGGLTPENVGSLLGILRPYAVDARSGIEVGGKKSGERMTAFVRAVRAADAAADD
jgi:phosphoribosylanthranilate isomerase